MQSKPQPPRLENKKYRENTGRLGSPSTVSAGAGAKAGKPERQLTNCWRLSVDKSELKTPRRPSREGPHSIVRFTLRSLTIFPQ